MSICTINSNSINRSLEIELKFFTDDLESVLEQENGTTKLYLASPKESPATDSLLTAYIKAHFVLKQNNENLELSILGKEAKRDYTYVYVEVNKFKISQSVQLTNTLLVDYFDDQVNKVNFTNLGQTKSISFHKDFTSTTL